MTVLSVPVITATTSASSDELYSHLPAHSVTHSNSDATEGKWRDLSQYGMTHHATNIHVSMFSFPKNVQRHVITNIRQYVNKHPQ